MGNRVFVTNKLYHYISRFSVLTGAAQGPLRAFQPRESLTSAKLYYIRNVYSTQMFQGWRKISALRIFAYHLKSCLPRGAKKGSDLFPQPTQSQQQVVGGSLSGGHIGRWAILYLQFTCWKYFSNSRRELCPWLCPIEGRKFIRNLGGVNSRLFFLRYLLICRTVENFRVLVLFISVLQTNNYWNPSEFR
jgi:hypothetical protein